MSACSPTLITQKMQQTSRPAAITPSTFISFDGTELPLRNWLPEESVHSVMIAVHGFNDYSYFIHDTASHFAKQGIAVYAYDQRGFGNALNRGLWPGKQTMARDLQTFVSLIEQRFPEQPLFLLGESMGAAVVLHTAASHSIDVDGLILAAPAVWGWSSMPFWQRWGLTLAAHTMPSTTFTGESLHVMASDNRDMLIALSRDPLIIKATRVDTIYGLVNLMQAGFDAVEKVQIPALVLYGEKDEVIPKKPVLDTFGKPENRSDTQRLQLYNNGYHMLLRDLQADIVWQDILLWMQGRHALLPSEQQGLSILAQ